MNKNIIITILSILLTIAVGYIVCDKVYLESEPNQSANKNISETTITLTNTDAQEILKNKFQLAEKFWNETNTYCGPDGSDYENTIAAVNDSNNSYYKSNSFNSISELEEYLLQEMTKEVLQSNNNYNKENYLEQNDTLYCRYLGKAGIYNLNEVKTTYEITNITQNQIIGIVNAYYKVVPDERSDDIEIKNNKVNITLTKNNDIWQISFYGIQA